MGGGMSRHEEVVWAMWYAHRDRRVGDMLDLMHPDVVWVPAGVKEQREYRGYDGIRQMVADLRASAGPYSIRMEEVTETEPGVVIARGGVVPQNSTERATVEFRTEFREGRVVRVVASVNPPG